MTNSYEPKVKVYEIREKDKPTENRKDRVIVRLGNGVTNSDIMDSIQELSDIKRRIGDN